MMFPRCPTCDKRFDPQQSPALPFCSHRCRLIDLGRWLDEKQCVPCEPKLDDEEPVAEPPQED